MNCLIFHYFKSYNTESGYRVDILSCFHQSLRKVDESNRNFRLRFERNKPAYIPENIRNLLSFTMYVRYNQKLVIIKRKNTLTFIEYLPASLTSRYSVQGTSSHSLIHSDVYGDFCRVITIYKILKSLISKYFNPYGISAEKQCMRIICLCTIRYLPLVQLSAYFEPG